MAALPLFPVSPQHILVPCKVFDSDTDIYFDIYQLCADKHATTSVFCISVRQSLDYCPISRGYHLRSEYCDEGNKARR